MQKKLFQVENLKKYFPVKSFFGTKKGYIKAVDDISMDIIKGETFGLVGESGCGKSTLGRSIIRMHDITEGKILYKGEDITKAGDKELSKYRSEMQIIFQDPYSSLNPYWNVEEILEEPLLKTGKAKSARLERIEYLLNKVGMKKEDMQKFPYEFSGGQRQRIGIARALMLNPEFIMCDEPIAALDASIQAQVVNMLQDLQEEFCFTYLFVSHDLSMMRYISDRIGVMYLGNLVELSDSEEVYKNPLHPYTKALLSARPVADPKLARAGSRIRLSGELPSPFDNFKACPFTGRCPYANVVCREEKPRMREIEKGHFVSCHRVEEI